MDVEKDGKVERCGERCFFVAIFCFFCSSYVKVQEPGEAKLEHDVLQVPEDPAWFNSLVTSPSRIVHAAQASVQRLFIQILEQKEGWK